MQRSALNCIRRASGGSVSRSRLLGHRHFMDDAHGSTFIFKSTTSRQSHPLRPTEAAAVYAFADFLSRSLEIRHPEGLKTLVRAFVHDPALVDSYVESAQDVVVFAKRSTCTPVKTFHRATEHVQPQARWREPATRETTRLRLREELLQWQVEMTKHVNDMEPAQEDVETQMGKEFAYKWQEVLSSKPWTRYSQSFVSFLPPTSNARKHFNVRLQRFFAAHGRALWERYFWIGTYTCEEHVGPCRRLVAARAALGLLMFELYQLEGVYPFLFLDKFPHPYWPNLLEHPVHLSRATKSNALIYLVEEHAKRWPDWSKCIDPKNEDDPKDEEGYNPCESFMMWATRRSDGSCSADNWLEAGATPMWFSMVLEELNAMEPAYNAFESPYISVVLPEGVPKRWNCPNIPPGKWQWDWNIQRAVKRPSMNTVSN
ncbi:hypothetical protein AeRB84_018651 [Aphanomyces euteiches]|nr:hypothetical protein AeRB84_018651 [Aphanomyces euteiches]